MRYVKAFGSTEAFLKRLHFKDEISAEDTPKTPNRIFYDYAAAFGSAEALLKLLYFKGSNKEIQRLADVSLL